MMINTQGLNFIVNGFKANAIIFKKKAQLVFQFKMKKNKDKLSLNEEQ